MPAIFDTLALPTDRSAKLMLIHPVTRAPLTDEAGEQGWIELYSWESEQAQAHRLARDNAQRKLGREFTAEEEWEDMGQMLARLTKAWHLVGLDGRAIAAPCSFDLAAGAFNATGLRWLRNAAIAFLNVSGNFFPLAGSTPSAPMAATNSG
ncbi:hypothetical protein GXW74_03090 [Roseomonas eburnea]|uniref:Uncharacterized protein n=1 Tax=Neoroseomonas eburnea TaxID=1346889 RepID=A0A9X9X6X4_9PROT|nr:hypothetical protein [Neoroseomonas eburnea]MBR0679460.1 hypothetical protein [Neoroseomonas eburnea]